MEVNLSPSLTSLVSIEKNLGCLLNLHFWLSDAPIDYKVKTKMLCDLFSIVGKFKFGYSSV